MNKNRLIKQLYATLLLLCVSFVMVSCVEIIEAILSSEDNPTTSPSTLSDTSNDKSINILGNIQVNNEVTAFLNKCVVTSLSGVSDINNGQFHINVSNNDVVQTFLVCSGDHNVYMMARQPIEEDGYIIIDIESTALGFMTLHPILASVNKKDFSKLVAMIKESSKYQSFYTEIEKLISNNVDLFNENNTTLIEAYGQLFDDLCKNIDFSQYGIKSTSNTRSQNWIDYDLFQPFEVRIDGNTIRVSNTSLLPSYYGSVTTSVHNGDRNGV